MIRTALVIVTGIAWVLAALLVWTVLTPVAAVAAGVSYRVVGVGGSNGTRG